MMYNSIESTVINNGNTVGYFKLEREVHIHESILFGFPGTSDGVIVINYCLLYAKYHIYLEKLKDKNKKPVFNVDFLGYLSYLKGILKIEQNIRLKRNQIVKFEKFYIIFENL